MLDQVHATWRTGALVATLLTLDVSSAFDNAAHERHKLWKRRVQSKLLTLHHRITDILLMEGAMGQFATDTGIPQGSPLSNSPPVLQCRPNITHHVEGVIVEPLLNVHVLSDSLFYGAH